MTPSSRVAAHDAEDAAHLGLIELEIRGRRRAPGGPRRERCPQRRGFKQLDERLRARGLDADGLDDRHAELVLELAGVDQNALALRDIGHVERDHHGQAEALETQHEPQVLPQVGGVGHTDNEVRRALARPPAEQHIGRDLLVGSQRIEAIGARQIENAHAPPRGRVQRPFLALDGDARVIGDLLTAAGEHIE